MVYFNCTLCPPQTIIFRVNCLANRWNYSAFRDVTRFLKIVGTKAIVSAMSMSYCTTLTDDSVGLLPAVMKIRKCVFRSFSMHFFTALLLLFFVSEDHIEHGKKRENKKTKKLQCF